MQCNTSMAQGTKYYVQHISKTQGVGAVCRGFQMEKVM